MNKALKLEMLLLVSSGLVITNAMANEASLAYITQNWDDAQSRN